MTRTPRTTPGDSSWFVHDRLGMFIHWGLYSMGARHEWLMHAEEIPAADYEARYFAHFDPDLYDPEAWASAAADAGMRYMVVTAKHHEGFCLWDSKLTDYKATNTPADRDLLRPLLDAFRARGLRVGVYYSLLDWHHPDFTVDPMHAQRKDPGREKLNEVREWDRYRQYLHGQVEELLSDYGPIDILWADFTYDFSGAGAAGPGSGEDMSHLAGLAEAMGIPMGSDLTGKGAGDWGSQELLEMVRSRQPRILVNDRLGLELGWDITTPEQSVPRQWPEVGGEPALWESCQTFSGSWGYHRDEQSWKSADQLILMLIDIVGKGGNLLLNVGPTARGEFDGRALDRLRQLGAWMRWHGRSVYGCTEAPEDLLAAAPPDSRMTYNPTTNRLYVHLLRWPTQPLVLPGLRDRVDYGQLLHDGSELRAPTDPVAMLAPQPAGALVLALPALQPDTPVPVVELFLRR